MLIETQACIVICDKCHMSILADIPSKIVIDVLQKKGWTMNKKANLCISCTKKRENKTGGNDRKGQEKVKGGNNKT
jgi:hypothetical protein